MTGAPRLFVIFESDGPLLYPNKYQLRPKKSDAADHAMDNINNLDQIFLKSDLILTNDNRNEIKHLLDAWRLGQEFNGKDLYREIDRLRDVAIQLRDRERTNIEGVKADLKKKTDRLTQLKQDPNATKAQRREAQDEVDEAANKERKLQGGLMRIEAALVHVGEFKEYANLVRIFKSVRFRGCELSIVLTMQVDGQPVEVARIGTVVDAVDDARTSAQEKE